MTSKEKLKRTIDYLQWVLDQVEIDTRVAQDRATSVLRAIQDTPKNTGKSREYELTIIAPHEASLIDVIAHLSNVSEKLEVVETQVGKRLAYPINSQEVGDYYSFDLKLKEDTPRAINDYLCTRDNVLRFLLVKKDIR